jgi:hypothetical protein
MTQLSLRAATVGLSMLLVALVGSTCATASPVHATAYVPPLPVEVMERPFNPRRLPPGGVHVGSIGLDLVPVPATTPVRISLAGALALFDPEGTRTHAATRVAGRLVIASDGDWGDIGNPPPPPPTFTDRLSWLLVYSGTHTTLFGLGAGGPNLLTRMLVDENAYYRSITDGFSCTSYGLIDATTGASRLDWQLCEPRRPNPVGS